jgi:phage terminase large subunit-like protein
MKNILQNNPEWIDYHPGGFDPFLNSEGYGLDIATGQKAIDFIEKYLSHAKGELAGRPLRLQLWQKAFFAHLFGWKDKATGYRRFRECLLFIPRKQGKTLMAAAICLYFLFCEKEQGQEIYCVASDREQSHLLFDVATTMCRGNPDLERRSKIQMNTIHFDPTNSTFKSISSEVASKFGYNSSLVVCDELHVLPRDLIETLKTSMGARRQPLMVYLTTAGFDRNTICYEKFTYGEKVRDGATNDPSFFPVIFSSPIEDDWESEETWKKVNPNYGITVNKEYFEREHLQAKESPAYEATFRRMYLNQWTESSNPFISISDWDECKGVVPDLKGKIGFVGIDLAATQDLGSVSVCIPVGDLFYLIAYNFLPEDGLARRTQHGNVPFDVWKRQGWLTITPGAVIDYGFIVDRIYQISRQYELRGVLFDRWGSINVRQPLEDAGLTFIEVAQTYKDMSPPTKEFLRLILTKKIIHDGNPILRWCVGNLVVKSDYAGNLLPDKSKSTEKIDSAVASIMALHGALKARELVSVYETRGITIIDGRDEPAIPEQVEQKPEPIRLPPPEGWVETHCPNCGKFFEVEDSECARCGRYRDWKKEEVK